VLTQAERGESWNHWPGERARLLELIARAQARGLVIVSGDSHFGAFYRRTEGVAYPLLELTSSSLNFPMPERARTPPGPPDPARTGDAYYEANFGAVTIDWERAAIALQLHAADGTLVREEPSALGALRAD
jgi:alkaline phosphatase D